MHLANGTTLGDRYVVEGSLGRGGMAVVYRVRHLELGTPHALKVLTIPAQAVRERLLQEGRIQGNLRHRNVVAVTDTVTVGGAPGLVMELVDGPALDGLLATQRLTLEQADQLARGILEGVAAAHAVGLIHRDLKPANVLLAPTPRGPEPKITDFGLAKILAAEGSVSATRSGVAMGTPAYMAPEQIRDAKTVDARADVWSLGCVLYELVAGERAFGGSDMLDIFRRIGAGELPALPALPERMAAAISGALRTDPDERIQTVAALFEIWTDSALELDPGAELWSSVSLESPTISHAETLGSDGPDSTFVEPAASEAPMVPLPVTAPPPAAPARRWRTPWVALLGVLVVGLAVAGLWPASAPDRFEADRVPWIADDAATRDAARRAWDALLAVEASHAVREAEAVVEAAPGSIHAHVLLTVALVYAGRGADSLQALAEAEDLAEEEHAPGAALAAAMLDRAAGLQPYVEAHPDDLLARMMLVAQVPRAPHWDAHIAKLRAQAPQAVLPHFVAAARLLQWDALDETEDALEAGLAAFPRSPALLHMQGQLQRARGDIGSALASFEEVLRIDPALNLARVDLAVGLLGEGRTEESRVHADLLRADSTPVAERVSFAQIYSSYLLGMGQGRRAMDEIWWGLETARTGRAWASYAALTSVAMTHAAILEDDEGFLKGIQLLRRSISEPELPRVLREQLPLVALTAEGLRAASQGELDAARDALERLEQAGAPPGLTEQVAMNIAVKEGDRAALEVELEGPRCHTRYWKGRGLFQAGFEDDGAEVLRDIVTGVIDCPPRGRSGFFLADALSIVASVDLARGEREAAAAWVRRFRETWPDPEPGSAPLDRVEAVERALGLAEP